MRAIIALKRECFKAIGSSNCFCCFELKTIKLVFHHLSYNSNSVTYNKFKNSNIGRLQYHAHLLDEINQDKTNFIVLCIRCHEKLEDLLKLSLDEVSQIKKNIPPKLIEAYNITQRKRGKPELISNDSFKTKRMRYSDDVFYESFVKRVNYISNHIALDRSAQVEYQGLDYILYLERKNKLNEFASHIPDDWGYSFHEGDSILHIHGEEMIIGYSTDPQMLNWLQGLGLEENEAQKLCDDIAWILDCSFFRELIPHLEDSI